MLAMHEISLYLRQIICDKKRLLWTHLQYTSFSEYLQFLHGSAYRLNYIFRS